MGAGLPANTGEAGASRYRVACFAGKPAPTGIALGLRLAPCQQKQLPYKYLESTLKACAVSVGAGSPANTGKAGARRHRVARFAGKPAPTGYAMRFRALFPVRQRSAKAAGGLS